MLAKIYNWSKELPEWQRDALYRLYRSRDGLSDEDHSKIYELFKRECGLKNDASVSAEPLAEEHIPAEPALGESVILLELSDLKNVNRIPNNQRLKFSPSGITIIYGENGTGKTGFARVMKNACKARDSVEVVLPDATILHESDISPVPSAKFKITVSGIEKDFLWSQELPAPEHLSKIAFFDSKCARLYVTDEGEPAYLPYGQDIVERLASEVMPRISEKIEETISNIDVDTTTLPKFDKNTEVGKKIETLSADTDPKVIENLAIFSTEQSNRIKMLTAVLAKPDHVSEANRLGRQAQRLENYAEFLDKALDQVSETSVNELRNLIEKKEQAIKAEKLAVQQLHSNEDLLPETGGEPWKLLFAAAQQFASEFSFLDIEFPPSTEGSQCPLCQQVLTSESIERLQRFNAYIKGDVTKTANKARGKAAGKIRQIKNADLSIMPDEALKDELKELDQDILNRIERFQSHINSRRQAMLKCAETASWENIPRLVDSPLPAIQRMSEKMLERRQVMLSASDENGRRQFILEQSELAAKQTLKESLPNVLRLIRNMKKKRSLEKIKRTRLKTTSISVMSKKLTSEAITNRLQDALDKEFEGLGIGHIKTKLGKRSVQGKVYYQLLLDIPSKENLDKILSEGEQRAIALGAFLAELSLAEHSCGIVFDDPISSLDHWHREKAAKRLVEEAKHRQVIVFTHDMMFLQNLIDVINPSEGQSRCLFLERVGNRPGYVNCGLPWDYKGYKSRIDRLEKRQRMLLRNYSPYPGEDEKEAIRHCYSRLRATIELVVREVVFNRAIQRYGSRVQIRPLNKVIGFSIEEYTAIQELYDRCSNAADAHDTASILNACDLGENITQLKNIVNMIDKRQKKRNPTDSSKSNSTDNSQ